MIDNNSPFGRYAPGRATFLPRLLTKIGVSRGSFGKWVAKQWLKKNHCIVDVTIRGINYRLNIDRNNTDKKMLTSSKIRDKVEIASVADAIKTSDIPVSESIFVDIGANTGYYTLNAAKAGYAKVIAVEPNPPVVSALLYNIKINNITEKVDVVTTCIGNGETVSFYAREDWGGSSIVIKEQGGKLITMQTKPLLEILRERNIKHVNALKIDIEGYEDKVLLPFFTAAPDTMLPKMVVIEYCHQHLWQNDIIKKMTEMGYAASAKMRSNMILWRQ